MDHTFVLWLQMKNEKNANEEKILILISCQALSTQLLILFQ